MERTDQKDSLLIQEKEESPEKNASHTRCRVLRECIDIDTETGKAWQKLRRSTRLADLESTTIATNDIEIRIWTLPGFTVSKTKSWVFTRRENQWLAAAFTDAKFNGNIVKKSLGLSANGTVKWDSYVNEVLNPSKIQELNLLTIAESDALSIILEVKFGSHYAVRHFVGSSDYLNGIFDVIRSEFFQGDKMKWSEM